MKSFYLETCHSNMLQRCYNSKDPSYNFYGGKGVSVTKRWLGKHGCINFIRDVLRSIGPRPEGINPKTGLSCYHLDRIDNNLGYQIGNLRWAPLAVSLRNKRPSKREEVYPAVMFTNATSGVISQN
jgi:hypothetical protein